MLCENIKMLRRSRGLSQEELAIKLHVVRQTVSKWEKGLSVPDAETLMNIAEELDTTVAALLGETAAPGDRGELKVIAAKLEVLNEQFAKQNERRRRTWRAVFLIMGILTAGAVLFEALGLLHHQYVMEEMEASSAIIGGYDGPTDIFVSNISLRGTWVVACVIGAIISAVGLYRTRRK